MAEVKGLLKAQKHFQKRIKPMTVDADPMEITYGLCDGKMQWFCIQCDYPYFSTIPMGESYEEALKWVEERLEEFREDTEE